jgi:uncharacterized membrane protein
VGLFLLLLFVALIVLAVLVLIRLRDRRARVAAPGVHDHTPTASEALRILNERFARGEIDAEEFTMRRTLLTNPT